MKKPFKLVIASGKGGVGKSMLASALAMLFAQEKKVVAVDADVDAPNLHLWLGQTEPWDKVEKISVSEKPTIDKTKCNLCGKCVNICQFNALTINNQQLTINNFFCESCGACEVVCPQKAITMKATQNAEIRTKKIVHGFPLISAQLYPGETGSGKIVDQIKEKAEKFPYEVMLLDAPAGTGCPVIAAVKNAHFALLVTEPTPSGFADLKRVLSVVQHFQIPWSVIINKWDLNPQESKKIKNWSQNKFLGKINYDQRIFQAISQLKPIIKTNLPAKKEVKKIYRLFIKRL